MDLQEFDDIYWRKKLDQRWRTLPVQQEGNRELIHIARYIDHIKKNYNHCTNNSKHIQEKTNQLQKKKETQKEEQTLREIREGG